MDVLDDGLLHDLEEGLDAPRRVDHDPATRDEHPMQFREDTWPVLHEHQTHLAECHVVDLIGKRKL